MSKFASPSAAALVDAHPPVVKTDEVDVAPPARAPRALPDLNLPAPENKDAAPSLALPTPSPETCVLLRRFASTMAACPDEIRVGTWSPVFLGLINRLGGLRLDDPSKGPSRR